MNIILVSLGTAGDVYPFAGLGIALRDRGHRITLMFNEHFKSLATDNDLRFVPIGTSDEYQEALVDSEEYQQSLQEKRFWRQIEGVKRMGEGIARTMRAEYQAVAGLYEPGNTVVVASAGAFGARIAHEKLGVPIATIALQPALFRSAYKMPAVAGAPRIPGWIPPWTKRLLFRAMDVVLDRICHVSEVNAFRACLGLRPVNRLVKDWWLSPQRVIALFPEWYGMPQPDWAKQIRMTGFPLYDGRKEGASLPAAVESFLRAGDPPIVFTPGSGMVHGRAFFEAGLEACEILKRRAILLTRRPDRLPKPLQGAARLQRAKPLPDSVRHFAYLPLSRLLPHAAAIVHHGGVGTLAQALEAGIPQLVMPMAFDQPDNAMRLKRLGVGDWLKPKAFRGPAVAQKLQHLLGSPEVGSRCRACARKVDREQALRQTCELIEETRNAECGKKNATRLFPHSQFRLRNSALRIYDA